MRLPLKIVVLLVGCVAVTIEALTGNGPVDATAILTVAGCVAL